MRLSSIKIYLFISFFTTTGFTQPIKDRPLELWFKRPASEWNEALPVGNGRLGAMVFGDVHSERLQLNESSVWSGSPADFVNPKAKESLSEIRRLLFEEKYVEADELASNAMMGDKRVESSYQTLGDLKLNFKYASSALADYKRNLNISNAIASVNYSIDDVTYTREVFSSAPDQVIVVRLSASKQKSISFILSQSRTGDKAKFTIDNKILYMREHVNSGSGVKLVSALKVINEGGVVNYLGDSIQVKEADNVTILISAATNYKQKDYEEYALRYLNNAAKLSYLKLKERHITDYQKYFNRVSFSLGANDTVNVPTDVRLSRVKKGHTDPGLITLYYQFGRYLLISSSRPGGLPANLQGIWADGLNPPWSADYHININIQMNYWLSELTNLSELHEPFLKFIDALREDGRKTAKEMYGIEGAVAHFTTDAWRFTETYGEPKWAMWPMGLAWSAQHLWEHYLFTKDLKYLRELAYPAMKDAAEFCKNWLVEDPSSGYLVSGPSISPENTFKTPEGKVATMVMGPTMDHMIIRELLTNTIDAAEILKVDEKFRESLRQVRERLTPTRVGKDGRILEWTKEFEEPEPGHRHISHLYGLHPGKELTKDSLLLKAARKTIDYRLAHGGGHTGWSRAWIINFFARLHDGELAYENLMALLQKSTLPNLFDTHPPFQIDGNFGATAGITEMLLQSHNDEILLLPALPKAWENGSIYGICARGGLVVDLDWKQGKLDQVSILSKTGGVFRIRYGSQIKEMDAVKGKRYKLNGQLH
ncbi:glycoside hydrolase family 95 protein [Chryseosolibacter indicus]|uniref:Glycoside hydrolase N-terminal domain-containing protein n=1 Tax=Chryseosolibacter indicus TaxID=2782351 RepID=A0ABS5VMV6_9BACT|nr:glycoside hydrolase family 95 protein [Chryseosolibacter indicus]MBT1702179.1 glycoside hydrolase N-terminal domain-containing protein [Chryseosolibacter indicus]